MRRFPTRFLVKPGHATTGSERVVEQTSSYLVVEKVGHAAETAIQLDPRPTIAQQARGTAMTSITAAMAAQANDQPKKRLKPGWR